MRQINEAQYNSLLDQLRDKSARISELELENDVLRQELATKIKPKKRAKAIKAKEGQSQGRD